MNLPFKKLAIAYLGIVLISACSNDPEIKKLDNSESISNELTMTNIVVFDPSILQNTNGRSLSDDIPIQNLARTSFDVHGSAYQATTLILNTDNPLINTQILLSPNDEEVLSIIDMETLENGDEHWKYYNWDGELYMESIKSGDEIQVVGAYELDMGNEGEDLANGRTKSFCRWCTSFGDCVNNTANTIFSSPIYSATFIVGLASGYSQYIAAGLAIGCGIYASGGGTLSYYPSSSVIRNAVYSNQILLQRYF